jgi:hypothetical protein
VLRSILSRDGCRSPDGSAASAATIACKRSVFANVIRYAVELGELPSSPLDRLSWKPPKVSEVLHRQIVVNPPQARELLTAVTHVGQNRRLPRWPRRWPGGLTIPGTLPCRSKRPVISSYSSGICGSQRIPMAAVPPPRAALVPRVAGTPPPAPERAKGEPVMPW